MSHRSAAIATTVVLVLGVFVATVSAASATKRQGGSALPFAWSERFQTAQRRAMKEEKPLLLYFCSSDGDDFTKKLDRQVFGTDAWSVWASAHVVAVKIDFLANKARQPAETRSQNEQLKTRFNIVRVPTLIFLDPWGEPLARCGYSAACLRENEADGQPDAWLAYCQSAVDSRPSKETLQEQPNLWTAIESSRKTAVPVCIVVHQAASNKPADDARSALLQNQLFIRFINRNMGLVQVAWPDDADTSAAAKWVRDFAAKWKIGPSPLSLIVWSPGNLGEIKAKILNLDPNDCQPLVKRLESLLPTIDYGGGWLEDWKTARAVSTQQNRPLLVSFVSSDGSEYSKRMQSEIYDATEFQDYARKALVLMKVDFPKDPVLAAKQSKGLVEQNNMLADMFGVRGYPTVVVLNPKGQKILDGKYMKGGASVFVEELSRQVKQDNDRRTLLSVEATKDR